MIDTTLFRRLLAVLFSAALVVSACGGGGDDGTTVDGADDTEAAATDDGDSEPTVGADESADGSDAVTAEDETVEVVEGGTLRIGLQNEAGSLNPTNTGLNRGPIIMATAIFDTLVVVDTEGQWHNNLTESWIPNDDFSQWDVTMREGIVFSDGEVMDAAAVVKTIEAFLADPLTSLVFKPAFASENAVELVDDMTFRLTASGPNAALPYYFAEQLGMIGSPAWLDARDANPELDQTPIGAGPYMITERIQDQITTVERNPNYWGEPGILDTIEFYPVVQDSTRTDQLLAGDLDLVHGTDAESILRIRDEADISRIEDNSGEEFMMLMNAQVPPFDDIRVREAATAAFPKTQYGEFIDEGTALEADSLFSSETPWNVPGLEQPDDRPEVAGPLIAAYCADVPESCSDDGRVNIEFQHDGPSLALDRVATLVGDAWSEFFNIEIQVIPNDQHINEVIFGQYQAATWRYHGFSDPDVDTAFFSCSTIGALSINWSRNCNEERDALIAQQRATEDFDERYAIWAEIQENLRDSYQYITASHTNWMVSSAGNVGGLCDAVAPDGAALPCQIRGVVFLPQLFLTN